MFFLSAMTLNSFILEDYQFFTYRPPYTREEIKHLEKLGLILGPLALQVTALTFSSWTVY